MFIFRIALYYWIDLSDLQEEGIWKWMEQDAPAVYTNWAPGQPTNYDGNEDCGMMYKTGGWNDEKCEISHQYICESQKSE